ncbi:hypothetical protein Q8A73_019314 [Channa argus]|nr:hypothetical protein Q8A73_019314 [Channa argus]
MFVVAFIKVKDDIIVNFDTELVNLEFEKKGDWSEIEREEEMRAANGRALFACYICLCLSGPLSLGLEPDVMGPASPSLKKPLKVDVKQSRPPSVCLHIDALELTHLNKKKERLHKELGEGAVLCTRGYEQAVDTNVHALPQQKAVLESTSYHLFVLEDIHLKTVVV